MIFLDTNVLIAATQSLHPHHEPSRNLLSRLHGKRLAIATHSIAEVYSALTGMPLPRRVATDLAAQSIEAYLALMSPISLTAEEYIATVQDAARRHIAGGMIYDALLLACARKIHAKHIYTWNLKHFRAIAPDLADRITTP